MTSTAQVTVHSSQYPDSVRSDLLASLRSRCVNHKFHYDSVKQTQKWLALHQAYSPSRNDPDCAAIYDQSFQAATERISSTGVHLIGLGCGGGQKDTRLLARLKFSGRRICYTPCDVSTAMVLVAREAALVEVPVADCFPFVCDLAKADDLNDIFEKQRPSGFSRLLTFFGMIPNFEQEVILPKLSALVQKGDRLLFSANLAPGPDYVAGLQKVLPLYDNALTQDWLMTFLLDLGIEREDGHLRFVAEEDPEGSKLTRITARFQFSRPRKIALEQEEFAFQPGEDIRLFFSYRHTPERIIAALKLHGLQVTGQWISSSGEEGVFLCERVQALVSPPATNRQ